MSVCADGRSYLDHQVGLLSDQEAQSLFRCCEDGISGEGLSDTGSDELSRDRLSRAWLVSPVARKPFGSKEDFFSWPLPYPPVARNSQGALRYFRTWACQATPVGRKIV